MEERSEKSKSFAVPAASSQRRSEVLREETSAGEALHPVPSSGL